MTRKFHHIMHLILLTILFCLFCGNTATATTKAKGESLDRIIAIVNDGIITQTELNDAIHTIKKQLTATNTPIPPDEVIRKRVLEQIIDRKLQLQLAEQAGMQVTDAQITKAIAEIAAQNKVSVKELYEKVRANGMDQAAYHKEIREEIILQQVQQHEVGAHIIITPQEVDDFMRSASWKAYNNKEYHLEDILIALPEAPSTEDMATAKKQAEDILAKIHKGTPFSEIAADESGNNKALQGGDLGWLKLPQIPPAFATELVHMKQNEILGPLPTPNGYHIIKLAGIREVNTRNNSAAQRQQIQQLLYQRKMDEGLQSWTTKLRSEAFINTNLKN